eukprot:jgi/Botrbrau1/3156/Bobra.0070s0122.1
MGKLFCTVLLLSCTFSVYCEQNGLRSNVSDEEYYQSFQRSFQQNSQKDGIQLIMGLRTGLGIGACLMFEEMAPVSESNRSEVAVLVRGRHTLYGPGIISTNFRTLLLHYNNLLRVMFRSNDVMVTGTDVPVLSAFLSQSRGDASAEMPRNSKCLFDPLQYTTLVLDYDLGFSRASKCWRDRSELLGPKGRMVMRAVMEDSLHDFGFRDVHVLSVLSGFLYYPHPWIKYLIGLQPGSLLEAVNTTLEIFGPCAVPFLLEKQTLLQKAVRVVVERDIDIDTILIKSVHHSTVKKQGEESVNVTMTHKCFCR